MLYVAAGILLLSAQVLTIVGFLWHRSRRKVIEADLIRSNERLRLAMESGRSVGWDWDLASGRDVWFGDLRTFFGIPSDQHTGLVRDFFQYVHPDDRQRVAQAVADARRNREPYSSEFRIPLPDGTMLWVAARGEFQYAADGSAIRMLGLAVDVTERKRIEEALKTSEEKYSKAFRESPLMITVTTLKDGHFVEINDTLERVTGWSRDQLIGRTSIDAGIWGELDQRADFVKRLSSGTLRNIEFSFRTRKGDLREGLLSADLIEMNGEACILSVIADITERKLAEAALRESEERFRLAADSAPVTIWMSDVNNICVYVNQRWLEITGRPAEAELGRGWTESIHPDDLARCLAITTNAHERREAVRVEYRLRRYDGEYIWILDSGVPRFNADGSYAGYIGSAVDVTEIKVAEQILSSVSQRLIEAHEEERTWLARELHDDIVQRLVLLSLKLEGIKRELPDSLPLLMQDVRAVSQQVDGLGKDIRTLSHNLHPSKLKYLGLTKAAASFCAELSAENVKIEFQSESVPVDLPDEVALCVYRVLQEALQNAIKHSGSRSFNVCLNGGSNEIHLAVRDSGVGFDPAVALKGQGLGLNSMKERLKLVNGSLVIDSQRRYGTTIHARVPFNSEPKAAEATRAQRSA